MIFSFIIIIGTPFFTDEHFGHFTQITASVIVLSAKYELRL